MAIEDKYCDCGEIAFTCANLSTGQRIYKCKKTKKVLKDDKSWEFIDSDDPPCEFKEIIQESEPPKIIPIKKKKYISLTRKEKLEKDKTNIKSLIKFFLISKNYVTFQEIEWLCKKRKIDIFNHHKETMYEFTQRVLREFNELS